MIRHCMIIFHNECCCNFMLVYNVFTLKFVDVSKEHVNYVNLM